LNFINKIDKVAGGVDGVKNLVKKRHKPLYQDTQKEGNAGMPIYEYECQACGHLFEVKQGFNDPPVKSCEVCQGRVRKVIHPPAIQFKGSGWYVTDYPSADRKKSMEAEKKESQPNSTKEETAPSSSACSKSG
jgi:putative FmdB family regulatory protein